MSPLYPGLEIVTTALIHLTGLPVFEAAMLVLGSARLVFVLALYLVFERVGGSSRVAAIACLLFMGSSTFVFFDTHFSYERPRRRVPGTAILAEVGPTRDGAPGYDRLAFLTIPFLAALAPTHHTTAYFAAGLLVGHAVLATAARRPGGGVLRHWTAAVLAVVLPVAWSREMGDPGSGYLGPVLENGLQEVAQLLTFSFGRKLFVSDDGTLAPAWQRYLTLASVALTCLGLATGFLRALVLAGVRAPSRGSGA